MEGYQVAFVAAVFFGIVIGSISALIISCALIAASREDEDFWSDD